MRKQVNPSLEANGLCNPFTNTKKWTITCGNCQHSWKEKIPCTEICSALCPCCGAQNLWSLPKFIMHYNQSFKSSGT